MRKSRGPRSRRLAVLSVLVTAGVTLSLAACSSSGSAKTNASGPSGKVLESLSTDGTPSEWVKWDKSSCSWQKTDAPYSGPYVVKLRTAASGYGSVGWTPQDTVSPNLVIANKDWTSAAGKTGVGYFLVNNNYPDTQSPITAANAVVSRKPAVVMSMNVLADLQKSIFEIYKAACIPALAFSVAPPDGYPFIAGSWQSAGALAAQKAIAAAEKKGWTTGSMAILFCVNGALGTAKGGPYDAVQSYKSTAESMGVASSAISLIDCSQGTGQATTETSQSATRDWLTAHPNDKQLLMFGGPDVNGLGMYNAVVQANRTSQALVTGVGLQPAVVALLRKSDPTYLGSINFGLSQFGQIGIGVAEDVMDGKPIPLRIQQQLAFVDASNVGSS